MFINLIIEQQPINYQLGFQIPASPVMEGIINFHHDLFFFLTAILFFVFYLFIRCLILFNKNVNSKPIVVVHAPLLEIIWTLIPAIILVFVAIPSFSLLYSMDEIIEPLLTIKIIGHQWYWSYEFLDPNLILEVFISHFIGPINYPLNFLQVNDSSIFGIPSTTSSNYSEYNIEKRINLGNPSKRGNISDPFSGKYKIGSATPLEKEGAQDKINASEVYTQQNLIPTSSLPYSGSSQNGLYVTSSGSNILKFYYIHWL